MTLYLHPFINICRVFFPSFFLHFLRKPVVIHSSTDTNRTKTLHDPVLITSISIYQLTEAFNNQTKIMDCTKWEGWCQIQISVKADMAISFILSMYLYNNLGTFTYYLWLRHFFLKKDVYTNHKCYLLWFVRAMKAAIIAKYT